MSEQAYPPEHHFLRDLDLTTEHLAEHHSVTFAPLTDGVRDAGGRPGMGFLAALTDVNAAMVSLVAGQPKWTVTVALSLSSTGHVADSAVIAHSRLVRAGSNIIVIGVSVHDPGPLGPDDAIADAAVGGAGPLVANGLLTFARIPRSASAAAATFEVSDVVGRRRRVASDGAPLHSPLAERIGLEFVDSGRGVVRLERSDYVRNSVGAINGGVHGVMIQLAAEAANPGMVVTDLHVNYLSQARSSHAVTSSTWVRRSDDEAVCEVRVHDSGADGQLSSLATVGLSRPRG